MVKLVSTVHLLVNFSDGTDGRLLRCIQCAFASWCFWRDRWKFVSSVHLLGRVIHGRLLRSTGRDIGSVLLFMSNMLTSDGPKFCPLRICFFVFNDVVRVKVVSSVHLLGWVKVVSSALLFLNLCDVVDGCLLRYFGSGIVFVTLIVSNTLTLNGSQLYPVCSELDGPKLFPVCICFFNFQLCPVCSWMALLKYDRATMNTRYRLFGFVSPACWKGELRTVNCRLLFFDWPLRLSLKTACEA